MANNPSAYSNVQYNPRMVASGAIGFLDEANQAIKEEKAKRDAQDKALAEKYAKDKEEGYKLLKEYNDNANEISEGIEGAYVNGIKQEIDKTVAEMQSILYEKNDKIGAMLAKSKSEARIAEIKASSENYKEVLKKAADPEYQTDGNAALFNEAYKISSDVAKTGDVSKMGRMGEILNSLNKKYVPTEDINDLVKDWADSDLYSSKDISYDEAAGTYITKNRISGQSLDTFKSSFNGRLDSYLDNLSADQRHQVLYSNFDGDRNKFKAEMWVRFGQPRIDKIVKPTDTKESAPPKLTSGDQKYQANVTATADMVNASLNGEKGINKTYQTDEVQMINGKSTAITDTHPAFNPKTGEMGYLIAGSTKNGKYNAQVFGLDDPQVVDVLTQSISGGQATKEAGFKTQVRDIVAGMEHNPPMTPESFEWIIDDILYNKVNDKNSSISNEDLNLIIEKLNKSVGGSANLISPFMFWNRNKIGVYGGGEVDIKGVFKETNADKRMKMYDEAKKALAQSLYDSYTNKIVYYDKNGNIVSGLENKTADEIKSYLDNGLIFREKK